MFECLWIQSNVFSQFSFVLLFLGGGSFERLDPKFHQDVILLSVI